MPETTKSRNNQPPSDELITLREAAELSGLSHSHLRLLVRKGEIWGKKMGRDWFTTAQSIEDYVNLDRKPGPKPKEKN
jgi:excisionase family DNA binding protein